MGAILVFVAIVSLLTLNHVNTLISRHSQTLTQIDAAITATHNLAKLQASGNTTVGKILKEAGDVVVVLEGDMAAVCEAVHASCQPNG